MNTTAKNVKTTTIVQKRKPVFVKVDQLTPGTSGHTLTAKVLESNPVVKSAIRKGGKSVKSMMQPVRPSRIVECLIGDETGCILFTARNEQVDLMKVGTTVIVRNAKMDMFKDTMRLVVDKWGRIEVTEAATFDVKQDNNLSLVEYEVVTVNQ